MASRVADPISQVQIIVSRSLFESLSNNIIFLTVTVMDHLLPKQMKAGNNTSNKINYGLSACLSAKHMQVQPCTNANEPQSTKTQSAKKATIINSQLTPLFFQSARAF